MKRKLWQLLFGFFLITLLGLPWWLKLFGLPFLTDALDSARRETRSQPFNLPDFFLGLGTGIAPFIIFCYWEISRFTRQLKERPSPDKKIRLPFSRQTITLEEFKRMWGPDYPWPEDKP